MVANYIKIAWRNLVRKRAFTLLNTLGLSVGVAAALLLFLVARYELSFDNFHPQAGHIYRIARQEIYVNGNEDFSPGNPLPMQAALKADIPQFERIVSVYGTLDPQVTILGTDAKATNSTTKFIEKGEGLLVEPDFFNVFAFHWLIGQPAVLARPNVVVLSKTFANKYFRDYRQAIGKFLRINNQTTMQVVGVLADAPQNTDFPMNLVVSYESKRARSDLFGFVGNFQDWNSTSSNDQLFVRLPGRMSVASANALLAQFTRKHYEKQGDTDRKVHFLSPLADMHHDDRLANFKDKTVPLARIRNMATVAVLILLMACINFVNIYSALATRRAKEVGVRKVLGSQKKQLVTQFMTETLLVVLASLLLGLALAYFALPLVETVFGVPAEPSLYLTPDLGLYLLGLLLGLTVLSGLYPALVLSAFSPLEVFRKRVSRGWTGGLSLRQGLIVFQFATALVLIISTVVNVQQMRYVSQLNLGFEKEGVFTFKTDTEYRSRYDALRNELMHLPDVKSVTFSSDPPSSNNNWSNNFSFRKLSDNEGFQISMKMADGAYFDTYGMKFLAGRPYGLNDTLPHYVVNQTLLKKLGIRNPESIIGKQLRLGGQEPGQVVGVIHDFHTSSAREAIKPTVIKQDGQYYWNGSVRIQSPNLTQAVERIKTAYEKVFPEVAFSGRFYDDVIDNYYKTERQTGLLYQVFAGLTIFIACLGLFGLAAFTAESRTKEIGVRKVLGASVVSIIALLSTDFLRLVIVAIVIASPLAWYLMRAWLESFQYRIAISGWVFALAGLLAIGIALLTVSFQSIRAALMNPVKSLRRE